MCSWTLKHIVSVYSEQAFNILFLQCCCLVEMEYTLIHTHAHIPSQICLSNVIISVLLLWFVYCHARIVKKKNKKKLTYCTIVFLYNSFIQYTKFILKSQIWSLTN